MKKTTIIGTGRVATHLYRALTLQGVEVTQVNPRTLDNLPVDSDIYLLAVSDNAIPQVAGRLKGVAGIVAHTSGTTPITVLQDCGTSQGVFYPLQTFSKERALDYSRIPFFIEGSDSATEATLIGLASQISQTVVKADSNRRKQLHIAAVFACNFTNHLYTLASQYMEANSLDFNLLLPLIEETVAKLHSLPPDEAQTGPAIRRDTNTINAHLDALTSHPHLKRIYQTLSDSIITTSQPQ